MQQRYGEDGRPRLRQDDLKQNPQWTSAVKHGSFIEVFWNALEVLSQQKDINGIPKEERNQNGQPGALPFENARKKEIGWDERDLLGN